MRGTSFLDLVYDDEGFLRHDVHTGMSRKGADDTRDVVVWFEDRFGDGILVQVYIGERFVLLVAKVFEDVCLTYLTGTVKDEGLMVSTRLPLK